MAVFTWVPDWGAQVEVEPRVLVSRFGDGYTQRVADGINTMPEVWNLSFTLRSSSEATAITDFLKAQGGTTAFDWTTPEGLAKRFVCPSWKKSPAGWNNYTVNARFEEVFGQ